MKGQIIKINTGEEYLILDEKKINLKTYLLANKLDEKEEMTDTFSHYTNEYPQAMGILKGIVGEKQFRL